MYIIEDESAGFTSIPRSVYRAVVTLTTVGYGDISPQTVPGQMLASVIMIAGYSIIAVATGIVSVEISNAVRQQAYSTKVCSHGSAGNHDVNALYCNMCSAQP